MGKRAKWPQTCGELLACPDTCSSLKTPIIQYMLLTIHDPHTTGSLTLQAPLQYNGPRQTTVANPTLQFQTLPYSTRASVTQSAGFLVGTTSDQGLCRLRLPTNCNYCRCRDNRQNRDTIATRRDYNCNYTVP